MEHEYAFAQTWANLVYRFRWQVVLGWAGLVLLLGLFAAQTPHLLRPAGPGAESPPASEADALLRKEFPQRRQVALEVVFHADGVYTSDRGYRAQILAWQEDLGGLTRDSKASVEGPLVSPDRHTAALLVTSSLPADRYTALAASVARIKHAGPAGVYVGGPAAVAQSLARQSEEDVRAAERLSLPITALLLILLFAGIVSGGVPVATGLATVVTGLALLGLAARFHPVSIFALDITAVLGLALAVNYSLLMVSRFREELSAGQTVEAAVAATTASAGRATLVSGGTVMLGFSALLLSSVEVIWSVGLSGVLVVGASVLASLTLIPALLAVAGPRIDGLALSLRLDAAAAAWQLLARTVTSFRYLVLLVATGFVALLALPALHIDPAVGGIENLPAGDRARQAQSLAGSELGLPERQPLLVVVGGVADRAAADRVEALVRATSGRPVRGPADVGATQQSLYLHPPYAVYEVSPPGAAGDPATQELAGRLLGAGWPEGTSVQLAGEAVAYQDLRSQLLAELPSLAALVLGLTVAMLGLAFRSVAVPIKAVCLTLLSMGAALGVLAYVFQAGHGAGWLRFVPTGHVELSVVLVVLAVLFALSIDYEVFLVTRVREAHLAGGSTTQAVVTGLKRTGPIIVRAALIMAAVFACLVFSRLAQDKSLGLALAAGLLVDAAVIRLLLVPAAMAVLAGGNWWPEWGVPSPQRAQAAARRVAPPASTIPPTAQKASQPLPPLDGSEPQPVWIAPHPGAVAVTPPWVPGPAAASTPVPGWEVVPHPVKLATRERLPAVQPDAVPPPPPPEGPISANGFDPARRAHGELGETDATIQLQPTPAPRSEPSPSEPTARPAVCRACASVLPAPYMPCLACGLQPEEPSAPPLYILDTVTGLYNQRFLQPQLEYELVRAAHDHMPLSLILFQTTPGDAALRWMAAAVGSQLRETDLRAVVSRDPPRLVALLHNTDLDETGRLAARVLATRQPGDSDLRAGVVCVQPGSIQAADEVVAAALRSVESGLPEIM